MKTFKLLVLLSAFTALTAFRSDPGEIVRNDFREFYDDYGVEGSFIMLDQKTQKYTVYNPKQLSTSYTPASTFKILNSLIALETAVVADEHQVFKWDGQQRSIPAWNANTDMRNAFKNSTVWYYQELARRVGEDRMKLWLNNAGYGNGVISGGIDAFWLTGGLRITPREQIDLLVRLQGDKLPFSKLAMDVVKDIMVVADTVGYTLRAKTGLGKQGDTYVGWYVGYITTKDNTYYFANCIQTKTRRDDFAEARLTIVKDILDRLKIVQK